MKNSSVWDSILIALAKEIPQNQINKWLKPLKVKEVRNNIFILSAPNKFFQTWAEDNYLENIKKVLKEEYAIEPEIKIVTEAESVAEEKTVASAQTLIIEDEKDFFSLPLDNKLTFENFVSGHSNRYAYSACVAVAKGLENIYNPLYIYGDIGLGKTHLMQAAGNELRKNFPKLKILYTTGEAYLNDYVNSLRVNKQEEFKKKYASLDVLLFDDVQSIVRGPKNKTQEEFFFMFNILYATNKRIILTSNTRPSEITDLDKRLSNRFASGLMVDVQSPSVDEKIAILLKHLEIMQVEMNIEVVHFLAENLNTVSVRDMIGCIRRLTTLANFQNAEINIDFASDILKDFLINRDGVLSTDKIIETITNFFHLKPVDLRSKKRSKNIVYPRSIAMYLLREKTKLSLSEVGSLFDRDHSTVLTAINKISEQEKTDPELQGTLETLRQKMKIINY